MKKQQVPKQRNPLARELEKSQYRNKIIKLRNKYSRKKKPSENQSDGSFLI